MNAFYRYRRPLVWTFLLISLLTGAALAAMGQDVPRKYLITDFGAIADSKTLNTKAIQSVIDRIASDGGGTLVVPKGIFISGALFFKPGVNLTIESGGVLKGTIDKSEYPQIHTR